MSRSLQLGAVFAVSLLLSLLLTFLLIRLAPRLGLVDHPNARKVHTRVIPKGGGLAIFATSALTTSLLDPGPHFLFLALSFGIVALGLVDDFRPLPWPLRLVVQAALTAIWVFVVRSEASWANGALAILWVVGMINAFNMLDNMDALSAGVAWLALGFVGLTFYEPGFGLRLIPPLFLALMGALAGFLWFNRPPARIFMGDAGSTFLGFSLGLSGLGFLGMKHAPAWSPLVPVCVLAVPLYDMASVVLLRLTQGRSPFHADKQHLSHRLVELGLSKPHAVGVIYLLAIASGLSGLVLYHVADVAGAALVIGQLGLMWVAVAAVEYVAHWKKKPDDNQPV